MSAINDDSRVKSRTELLLTNEKQQTKTHIVYDADKREKFIFVAPIDAKDGDPCICTEYTFLEPNSTAIRGQQERVYPWKTAWESAFTFDPNANYDPDGNGFE